MAERSRSARTRDQGALRKEKNKKAAQDDEDVDQEGAEQEAATAFDDEEDDVPPPPSKVKLPESTKKPAEPELAAANTAGSATISSCGCTRSPERSAPRHKGFMGCRTPPPPGRAAGRPRRSPNGGGHRTTGRAARAGRGTPPASPPRTRRRLRGRRMSCRFALRIIAPLGRDRAMHPQAA